MTKPIKSFFIFDAIDDPGLPIDKTLREHVVQKIEADLMANLWDTNPPISLKESAEALGVAPTAYPTSSAPRSVNEILADLKEIIKRYHVPIRPKPAYPAQMECPLCFRHLTVEIHHTETPQVSSFFAFRIIHKIQYYCAVGCGFTATYMAESDTLTLNACPDEPEPTRLAVLETWSKDAVLMLKRNR